MPAKCQNQPLREMTFSKTDKEETFADVLDDVEQPFDEVLAFFSDKGRQQRMEDAEIHHGPSPSRWCGARA